ncbi:MAG: hypothetical protein WHS86_15695 [Desulfosoma sp.]
MSLESSPQESPAAGVDIPWMAKSETPAAALSLPSKPVSMFLRYPGPRSRFQMIFSDVPEGSGVVNNAAYDGWCLDRSRDIPKNAVSPVRLYSSTDPMLPGHLARYPWGEIHYLINHKSGSPKDVQAAIWHLTDGGTKGMTPDVRAMVEEARRFGKDYSPKPGELLAVVCEPRAGLQTTFIEYPLPGVLGAEGVAPPWAAPQAPESKPASVAPVYQLLPPALAMVDPGHSGVPTTVAYGGGGSGPIPPQEKSPAPIPLPGTAFLLAPGLAVTAILARRRR